MEHEYTLLLLFWFRYGIVVELSFGTCRFSQLLGLLLVEPVLIPVDVNPARDVREHAGRILDVTLQLTDAGAQLRVGPRPGLPPQRRIDGLCPIVAQGPLLN